jgi:RHS repeat-associated protein
VVNYNRDLAGNVTSVSTTDTQGTFEPLADQIAYKPFGPMTGLTYGNGLTLNRSFNQSYQMTGYQVPGVLDRTINYTPDGNIWGIQDHLQSTDTSVFEYDPVDQLIGAGGGYGTRLFDYDANGNRTWVDRDGLFDEYEVAYYSNRLMETLGGQIQYTYDANGNPVARGTDSFSYDSHNRLKSATVAGQSASYGYNVSHQRVSKTVGSDTTAYFYGPGGELLAEVVASSGLTSAEYAWLNGEPLAHFQNGSTYFVHNDHLATPQRLTDSTGAVAWSADYEPFGKATTTGIEFNLRFPGQYFDAETRLHYNWHRYYDPSTGRYITSDPLGLEGGLNTYVYAVGNPVLIYDPYGLFGMEDIYGGIYRITGGWSPDQSTVDIAAGFGDSISFNLTKQFREWSGVCNVNYDSKHYFFSNLAGTAFGLSNAARSAMTVSKNLKRAKSWRSNSRTSRKTRAKKIANAGSYRPSISDATLTLIGGSGVDSLSSIIRESRSRTKGDSCGCK